MCCVWVCAVCGCGLLLCVGIGLCVCVGVEGTVCICGFMCVWICACGYVCVWECVGVCCVWVRVVCGCRGCGVYVDMCLGM